MLRSVMAGLVGAVCLASVALAQDTTSRQGVRIGLTYQPGTKPGVLVLPVAAAYGDSVRAILERDLDHGDRVTVVPGSAAPPPGAGALNYSLYGQLGAAAVVRLTLTGSGGIVVVLHDVAGKRVIDTRTAALIGAPLSGDWRMSVHRVADELERSITGVRGIASTRIAFVRDGRVTLVDSDGANMRAVTDRGRALSPAWHPAGRTLAYSLFAERGGTQVVARDLSSGGTRVVSERPGLNITPTFSRDGRTIVFGHGQEAGTDLVAVAATGGGTRRVTVGRGSDNVSPTFSPDGQRLAFTSGRSGHPEVYISDADGTNAELLTPYAFGDQSYRSNPDWSPDGRSIAFQSLIGGRFQVMTISLRDRSIKQVTSEGGNEDPSWAPDGRHLVVTSTRTGSRQLFVIDVESGRARQLTFGGAPRSAAWSPALAQ